MEKWQVALCKWAETGRPASDWPSYLGWWPISVRQGRALGHGGAGGGPTGFWRHPTMRCNGEGPGSMAVGWWTRFGSAGRKKLTRRMSSTARCGRPKGNGGGGGVRGWWSIARSAERLYTAAQCSGRGRIGRREARAGCPWRLSGGGNGNTVEAKGEGGRKGAPRWGWAPFIAGRGGGRRRRGSGETVGGKIAVAKPWAWAR
jgi:hypothetical protein